jgi:rRNA-processing protein FCF1
MGDRVGGEAAARGERLHGLSDEPDNRILECAVAGNAGWIATGDRQILNLGRYEGVRIVTVRAMHEFVAGSPSSRDKQGEKSQGALTAKHAQLL